MSAVIPAAALIPAGLFPLLLLLALAVRFSGSRRILSSVDYAAIEDPAALHRWAGNRLLLLPASAGFAVALCIAWPATAVAVVTLFFLAVFLLSVGIAGIGNSKFASYGRQ
jgi:hypothetical protein